MEEEDILCSGLRSYAVEYREGYEPFVLCSRRGLPRFDERFRGTRSAAFSKYVLSPFASFRSFAIEVSRAACRADLYLLDWAYGDASSVYSAGYGYDKVQQALLLLLLHQAPPPCFYPALVALHWTFCMSCSSPERGPTPSA